MNRLPDLLERLNRAIDDLVTALEAGHADAVLAAEAPLAAAATELATLDPSVDTLSDDDRRRVYTLAREARTALHAAARLGASSGALLGALVGRDAYGRDGLHEAGGRS